MNFDEFLAELNINKEITLTRFAGMEKVLEKFLIKFSKDESIKKLEQAMNEGKTEDFERAAHTLKGLAANLGLDELSSEAAKCVQYLRQNNFEMAKNQYSLIYSEYERIIQTIKKYTS